MPTCTPIGHDTYTSLHSNKKRVLGPGDEMDGGGDCAPGPKEFKAGKESGKEFFKSHIIISELNYLINGKVFKLPRVAELLNHIEKQRGCLLKVFILPRVAELFLLVKEVVLCLMRIRMFN